MGNEVSTAGGSSNEPHASLHKLLSVLLEKHTVYKIIIYRNKLTNYIEKQTIMLQLSPLSSFIP